MTGEGMEKTHLRACNEHRIVVHLDHECPACKHGIEARPDDVVTDVSKKDIVWQIEPDTFDKLVPLIQSYLEDRDEGPAYIRVMKADTEMLPMGYTRLERWMNVIEYEWGNMKKMITRQQQAVETIEALREEGYDG